MERPRKKATNIVAGKVNLMFDTPFLRMTCQFNWGPMGRVLFTIYHSRFTRLRTYPQHTLSLLPLLRSRPGGVHKTSVVRSPKSGKQLNHCRLPNANCRLVFRSLNLVT